MKRKAVILLAATLMLSGCGAGYRPGGIAAVITPAAESSEDNIAVYSETPDSGSTGSENTYSETGETGSGEIGGGETGGESGGSTGGETGGESGGSTGGETGGESGGSTGGETGGSETPGSEIPGGGSTSEDNPPPSDIDDNPYGDYTGGDGGYTGEDGYTGGDGYTGETGGETGVENGANDEDQEAEESSGLKNAVDSYVAANAETYARTVVETLSYDESLLSNELGYRSAGSEAEHAAADWIAEEMADLGLTDIEKIPVTVDLFEFRDASLTIDGTDIDLMPASYQVNGTDADGITAEIVDCGAGLAEDYEGVDVKGKIALVGVNQMELSWISGYMAEAYLHGAGAVVSYDIGGYGTYDDDQINVQDVCQDDLLPTVAISYNDYLQIAEALEAGNNMATLTVDSTMIPEGGTTYDVAGRIKGKSSEQQIIISGHYDVYFNGVQDDSAAIGVVLGIAKTMIDSGYTPEHDIVFMAHGAEEWGATGTEFDWTTGAWELINNVKPEWAKSTVAMINFELSALYDGMEMTQISCVPEYANVVKSLVEESGLLPETVNNIYPQGYDSVSVDSNTMEDGVSYRFAGVPYFVNVPGTQMGEDGWYQQHYHTPSDDMSTYNADVMATNINTYGILAMYVDQKPAMMVDFSATAEDLEEAFDAETFGAAGADTEGYAAALETFTAAAASYNAKIASANAETDYAAGDAQNEKTIEIFKAVQDNLIGVIDSSSVVIRHTGYLENIAVLETAIAYLEENDLSALDELWQLNGGREYTSYIFSMETAENAQRSVQEKYNQGNMFWGTGKGYVNTNTFKTTAALLAKAYSGETDFSAELDAYKAALEVQYGCLKDTVSAEIEAMNTIASMMAE